MLKAVILIGGPQKGTRFRPLSFEVPKPLFPVAGVPMIQHHIEACAQVPGMQEILLIGFYQPDEALTRFLEAAQQEFNLPIRQTGLSPSTMAALWRIQKRTRFCTMWRNQAHLDGSSGSWPGAGTIRLEQDVFTALSGQGQIYVHLTDGIWSQIKSAGSALYASRLYLNRYQLTHPERLAQLIPGGPCIRGNVFIHPTAKVASSAVLGPNVSIGEGVTIGEGVRLRESIVLHGATLQEHTCVLHSIVGWGSIVGRWARVEGTPNDPNPNDPWARMDSESLFRDGKLLPAITILGCRVRIPAEVLILNSIVLPHKELSRSFTNQIIL
ncbi:mannose-1-phosphate guanyltransferase alpha isoform X3 [Vombatus ursinus]|uniref:mannose-1-phosphate guanyltransferase alpha isoform X3 n=1 Tax=Vombatus ursinus TaxID=29139 RepID=UPI000FFD8DD1|nr:mannose-1-phosphate guanyltransferase alpha isoform X3 [Vombatus ursinus]